MTRLLGIFFIALFAACSSPVEKKTHLSGSAVVEHEDAQVNRSQSQNKCQVPIRIIPEKQPDWAVKMAKEADKQKSYIVALVRKQSDWNIGLEESRLTASTELARSMVEGIVNKARRSIESRGGKSSFASSEFAQNTISYTEGLISDLQREEVYREEFDCADEGHYWDVYALFSISDSTRARLVEMVLKKIKEKSSNNEEKKAIEEMEKNAKSLFE